MSLEAAALNLLADLKEMRDDSGRCLVCDEEKGHTSDCTAGKLEEAARVHRFSNQGGM
jgi:hypothetical protein